MKELMTLILIAMLAAGAQGCSKNTRDSIEEVGNDMNRDVEDALD
jgi:hypothetical protein